jgi:hypothetical protein
MTLVLAWCALPGTLRVRNTLSAFPKVFDVSTSAAVTDLTADEITVNDRASSGPAASPIRASYS